MPPSMLRSLLALSAITSAIALSGCIELGETGCKSDEECRFDRVCSPSGACIDPQGSSLEPDAGPDADTADTDAEPDLGPANNGIAPVPYEMHHLRVTDACSGDLHTATFVLRPPTRDQFCEADAPIRIVVRIEGALDLNSQTPGETRLSADGIEVTACQENTCVVADAGSLTLDFYEPGEIVSGRLIASFPAADGISANFAGQEYDIDLAPLQLNWCGYADDECRF